MPLFRSFLVVLTFGFSCAVLMPPPALAWEFSQRGDGSAVDQASAVVLRGNVFAVGQLSTDVFAVKLQRNHGDVQWRFQTGTPSGFEFARVAAADLEGHLIIAGRDDIASMAVIKIDKDSGQQLWIAHVPGGDAFALGVDGAGDVIAAGTLRDQDGIDEMLIVKIRGSDGIELWRTEPIGTEPGGQVRDIAIDRSGNVVVTGFLRSAAFQNDFVILKVNGADGAEQWRHQIPSLSGSHEARAVAVDAAGDAVAAGTLRVMTDPNTLSRKFAVVKVSGASGSLIWRHDVDGNASSRDNGNAVVIDRAGDVIASGDIRFQLAVIKLAGVDGTEQWRHTGGPNPLPGRSVDVDRDDNVVAAGRNVVRKLFGATGVEIWQQTVTALDTAREVAFDNSGDVVVAGDGPGGFVVVKRNGSDGTDF